MHNFHITFTTFLSKFRINFDTFLCNFLSYCHIYTIIELFFVYFHFFCPLISYLINSELLLLFFCVIKISVLYSSNHLGWKRYLHKTRIFVSNLRLICKISSYKYFCTTQIYAFCVHTVFTQFRVKYTLLNLKTKNRTFMWAKTRV